MLKAAAAATITAAIATAATFGAAHANSSNVIALT
jgi:hypothetical protein